MPPICFTQTCGLQRAFRFGAPSLSALPLSLPRLCNVRQQQQTQCLTQALVLIKSASGLTLTHLKPERSVSMLRSPQVGEVWGLSSWQRF